MPFTSPRQVLRAPRSALPLAILLVYLVGIGLIVFGIYAIVQFVVQFFSTFGDVGIGAALIQKKGELSREELSTTFWLQQMLVWLVVGMLPSLLTSGSHYFRLIGALVPVLVLPVTVPLITFENTGNNPLLQNGGEQEATIVLLPGFCAVAIEEMAAIMPVPPIRTSGIQRNNRRFIFYL